MESLKLLVTLLILVCALPFLSEKLSEHCFIKTRSTKNWEREEHDQTDKHWKFVQITFVLFFICTNTLLNLYTDCYLWSYDCRLLLYIVSYCHRKVLITILKSKAKAWQVLEFRNGMLGIPLRWYKRLLIKYIEHMLHLEINVT